MDMNRKNDLDMIIEMAPVMNAISRSSSLTAAFCTTQDVALAGDDEAALYLLKNYPRPNIKPSFNKGEEEDSDPFSGMMSALFQ